MTVFHEGLAWVAQNTTSIMSTGDAQGNFRRFTISASCSTIRSLVQDESGSLWVGTYGAGLFRREGERFRGLTTRTGLSSDFVRALCQDHEGSLWIAAPVSVKVNG